MLQQTRVETVIPYYERFLERYPDARSLAAAPEAELLEAWAGLGYYRRARQLQQAARAIDAQGRFPEAHEDIRALPGVGDYTAAAVASIAFEQPHAAVDGNVLRVVSRFADDPRDISKGATRKAFSEIVQRWIETVPQGARGDFNQALMELGATVCTPRSPKCLLCPLSEQCRSFKRGTQHERPVKAPKTKLLEVDLHVAVVARGSRLLMRQRPANEAIMPGFWELPQAIGPAAGLECIGLKLDLKVADFRHGITTRRFRGSVYKGSIATQKPDEYVWISTHERASLPVTTITKKAIAALADAALG